MFRPLLALVAIALPLTLACVGAAAQVGESTSASTSSSGSVSGAVNNNVFTSPASTTSRISGSTSVRSVPSAISPGLAAAGIETCLGSASAGGSFLGGGFSFGSTTKDDDCNRRLYARQLYNMGFKGAAAVIQCLSPEVAYAMAVAGTPCPTAPGMPQTSAVPAAQQAGDPPPRPPGYIVNPEYVRWQQAERERAERERAQRAQAKKTAEAARLARLRKVREQTRATARAEPTGARVEARPLAQVNN